MQTKVGGSGVCLSENRHGAGVLKYIRTPDKREVGSSTLPRPIFWSVARMGLRARRGWSLVISGEVCPLNVSVRASAGCSTLRPSGQRSTHRDFVRAYVAAQHSIVILQTAERARSASGVSCFRSVADLRRRLCQPRPRTRSSSPSPRASATVTQQIAPDRLLRLGRGREDPEPAVPGIFAVRRRRRGDRQLDVEVA